MKLKKLETLMVIFTLILALVYITKAQEPAENMKTFFDSEIPGIGIQVNATAAIQPTENITVMLGLKGLTNVDVEYFNLSIFGFLYGEDKMLMANITQNDFSLNSTLVEEYNCTFDVPQEVWDVIYGEISLTYSTEIGNLHLGFPQLTLGFIMTHVENVYLENIEELLETYEQLNQTFLQCFQINFSAESLDSLNQTYWALQQNHTSVQGNLIELGNTRMAVIILAITTIFFVATTFYVITRKPKQYW
jgi:hypothetical protein